MREYMLKRYHERRAWVIALLSGKCSECPATENLQIDHIDRKKKGFDIAKRLSGASVETLLKEIKKCQLLCEPCHQKKTLEDFGRVSARTTHGTVSSYRYCKCDLCRAANAKYTRENRPSRARK
jgi:5-methylcytosine-specific restriction endonuclease McrA